eukprot:Platyproteum_vivax@DN3981_c0_g1_i1.p1
MSSNRDNLPVCTFLPEDLAYVVADCVTGFLDASWTPSFGNVQIVSVDVPIPNRWQDEPTLEDFANLEKDLLSKEEPEAPVKSRSPKIRDGRADRWTHKDAQGREVWTPEKGREWLRVSLSRLGLPEHLSNRMNELTNKSSPQDIKFLSQEKKKVKNELKRYDLEFKAATAKAPNREDKEPMRPLYTYYRRLKELIQTAMDDHKGNKVRVEEDDLDEDEAPGPTNLEPAMLSPTRPNDSARNGTGESYEELRLAQLYHQKNQVRQTLQTFQEQFVRANGRKIRYHKDIVPIEREYKAYKEVKADIATLESTLREQQDRRTDRSERSQALNHDTDGVSERSMKDAHIK